MRGEENLIHLSDRTPEERKAIASMGGKARAEQRRERKAIRECLMELQTMPMDKAKCAELGLPEGTPYQVGLAMSIVNGVMDGNPAMARVMLTALGEMKQDINLTQTAPPLCVKAGEAYPANYPGVILIDDVED